MDLHDEIAKLAYELYEKSGKVAGRDLQNWSEAERLVLQRHMDRLRQLAEEQQSPSSKNTTKAKRKTVRKKTEPRKSRKA